MWECGDYGENVFESDFGNEQYRLGTTSLEFEIGLGISQLGSTVYLLSQQRYMISFVFNVILRVRWF